MKQYPSAMALNDILTYLCVRVNFSIDSPTHIVKQDHTMPGEVAA